MPRLLFQKEKNRRAWEGNKFHPLLYEIVALALSEFARHGYDEVVCTSGIRTWTEDKKVGGSGIHVVGRAIDFAVVTKNPQQLYDDIGKVVNAAWEYDPKRPGMPVAYTDLHGTGPHVHLQVTDWTRRR